MNKEPIWEAIAAGGVVPVIAIDTVEAALPLADALIAGGLPIAEITFRTAAAPDVIRLLSKERPELIVGAGTVLTTANLEAAKECGAQFAVAPGLNPVTVANAREIGMPFLPGVATPTDIEHALGMGCSLLKFFPSEALGGMGMIKALAAPYAHAGVKFVPTGGVSAANLEAYLKTAAVAAVGGTWIATREDLANKDFGAVVERCKAAVDIVAQARATT